MVYESGQLDVCIPFMLIRYIVISILGIHPARTGTKRVKCIDGLRFPKGDDVKILAHQPGFCVTEVSLLRGSEVKIQIYG